MLNLKDQAYSNFVNSINSEQTREMYEYSLTKFLKYCRMDLNSFLRLDQQEISNIIINYLVEEKKRISRQYKVVIFSAIKHACEMNDVILNWKKLKKFIKSDKTNNSINGKDRGYTHEEIQKILGFSDQRLKTAFLVLASTGIRIGALQSIRISDLERIDDLYKITVYSGDREEYLTFCTPECAKEIDAYLDYRTRRGETITQDSYLLVRKFSQITKVKGKPFKGKAPITILKECITNSGLREIDHENPHKRKQIPIFHGFRKFFTTQLVNSKLNPEIREMLLGHKIILDYTVGLDKIYDRAEIEKKKLEPEFEREYAGKYLSRIGNIFSSSQIDECQQLGLEFSTDKIPLSLYNLKSVGIDPGFSSSGTGIVVLEHIKTEDNKHMIRVVDCHLIEKGDPNKITEILWDVWVKYGYMNVAYYIDGSNRAMVNLLKIRWQESLSWESNESFGSNVKIRPVNFSTEHKNMLSNLHAIISKGYLAIEEKHDKLLTSLRTAYAEELNLKKDVTSYSDLLDALRLSLKGYNIE